MLLPFQFLIRDIAIDAIFRSFVCKQKVCLLFTWAVRALPSLVLLSYIFLPRAINRLLLLLPELWQEKLSWVDGPWTILTLSFLSHTLLSVPVFPESIFSFLFHYQHLSVHWMNSHTKNQKLASFKINNKHLFPSGSIINFNFSIFSIIQTLTDMILQWNKVYLCKTRVSLTPTISDLSLLILVSLVRLNIVENQSMSHRPSGSQSVHPLLCCFPWLPWINLLTSSTDLCWCL